MENIDKFVKLYYKALIKKRKLIKTGRNILYNTGLKKTQ